MKVVIKVGSQAILTAQGEPLLAVMENIVEQIISALSSFVWVAQKFTPMYDYLI